ncbi:Ig-like domain-containing protein [Deinococcus pimensis]|uniref:Ig-like domain-containing protein n=1 Tax=Deinococcus pimensis TaxID=309888 RepID=UPI0004BA7F38|nr:Ig-like domain-containing protein [Deinococcus pimensis]
MRQIINPRFPKIAGLLVTLSLGVVACGTTETPTPVEQNTVTGINFGATAYSVEVGKTVTITAVATGTGTFDNKVTFSSSDLTVATINATTGVVTALKAGTVTITAKSVANASITKNVTLNVTAPAALTTVAAISFRDTANTTLPTGFTGNSGAAYNTTTGIGWVTEASAGTANLVGVDFTGNGRTRTTTDTTVPTEQKSFIHMQYTGANATTNTTPGAFEYKLPNGTYTVTVSVGDLDAANSSVPFDSTHYINVEGKPFISAFKPQTGTLFKTQTDTVTVTDGSLTVDAKGGTNTKLNYIIIKK